MKRIVYYLKLIISCIVIFGLVLPSYASLTLADGSDFVPKAEFEKTVELYNTKLTVFEAGINSKIDGQVSSYLDRYGIWSGVEQTFATDWEMTDYNWNAYTYSSTTIQNPAAVTKVIPIGAGCSWGDVFGCFRKDKEWHLSYNSTRTNDQKEATISSWVAWENHKNTYYKEVSGFVSLLLAGANTTSATTIAQVQWSPTLAVGLKDPSSAVFNGKIESVKWRILPEITKSGLLFLDFGQIKDFDAYINVNSQWQDAKWDAGLRYDFSIVFRRLNVKGEIVEDPWEEHWGDVSDSKINATKTLIIGGEVKRIGNDSLPYSISSAQINLSHFRKTINFFVEKGDIIEAVIKTEGFNDAKSYLGRHNWSYTASTVGTRAVHGPEFKFYSAIVY